ncbi:MAG TPA: CBS domain-containing protein, partial [Alphaproteobacteria bacterium]|nr:CBS domain-containing protein [Alphaproteobacteria bacterium]
GLVTDRDITVRATSAGKAPDQCRVSEVMTDSPESCSEEDDVQTVVQKMSQLQVRRMPVVRDGQLVGIVALGDLATEGDQPQAAAEALERISEPSEPDRSQTGVQGSGGQDQQGGGLDQLDRSTGGMGGGA